MEQVEQSWRVTDRRSFLLEGCRGRSRRHRREPLADRSASVRQRRAHEGGRGHLQFLAAAELLEADLWEQYNELGGIQDSERPGGTGNKAYTRALAVLDKDIPSTSTTTPMTSRATRASSTRI